MEVLLPSKSYIEMSEVYYSHSWVKMAPLKIKDGFFTKFLWKHSVNFCFLVAIFANTVILIVRVSLFLVSLCRSKVWII